VSTKVRIGLTVALGVLMSLESWNPWPYQSSGVQGFSRSIPDGVALAVFILVPLVVGRWWVVAALSGPFFALATLQVTGHEVLQFESLAQPLNPVTIAWLLLLGLVLLVLVGIRRAFDLWRGRRTTAAS
jgi:hypothetical protein